MPESVERARTHLFNAAQSWQYDVGTQASFLAAVDAELANVARLAAESERGAITSMLWAMMHAATEEHDAHCYAGLALAIEDGAHHRPAIRGRATTKGEAHGTDQGE